MAGARLPVTARVVSDRPFRGTVGVTAWVAGSSRTAIGRSVSRVELDQAGAATIHLLFPAFERVLWLAEERLELLYVAEDDGEVRGSGRVELDVDRAPKGARELVISDTPHSGHSLRPGELRESPSELSPFDVVFVEAGAFAGLSTARRGVLLDGAARGKVLVVHGPAGAPLPDLPAPDAASAVFDDGRGRRIDEWPWLRGQLRRVSAPLSLGSDPEEPLFERLARQRSVIRPRALRLRQNQWAFASATKPETPLVARSIAAFATSILAIAALLIFRRSGRRRLLLILPVGVAAVVVFSFLPGEARAFASRFGWDDLEVFHEEFELHQPESGRRLIWVEDGSIDRAEIPREFGSLPACTGGNGGRWPGITAEVGSGSTRFEGADGFLAGRSLSTYGAGVAPENGRFDTDLRWEGRAVRGSVTLPFDLESVTVDTVYGVARPGDATAGRPVAIEVVGGRKPIGAPDLFGFPVDYRGGFPPEYVLLSGVSRDRRRHLVWLKPEGACPPPPLTWIVPREDGADSIRLFVPELLASRFRNEPVELAQAEVLGEVVASGRTAPTGFTEFECSGFPRGFDTAAGDGRLRHFPRSR